MSCSSRLPPASVGRMAIEAKLKLRYGVLKRAGESLNQENIPLNVFFWQKDKDVHNLHMLVFTLTNLTQFN